MGDAVQATLDGFVPILLELQERGIFAADEVKSILKRRRDSEYALRRHKARKRDYLSYLEAEMNLEQLRQLRRTRLVRQGVKLKTDSIDYAGAKHINAIFDKAILKFPGDINIWLQYLDFASQQGSSKALSRVFARALQMHPREGGLWIKAASWEFFDNGNSAAARVLMQRGLRINKDCRQLWVQYFRLEWCYLQKLAGRRHVMGLEPKHDAVVVPATEEEEASPANVHVQQVIDAEASSTSSIDKLYAGAVPLAVFQGSIKALPKDLTLRCELLHICLQEFPSFSASVAEAVLQSLKQDFPDSEEAWQLQAESHLVRGAGSKRKRQTQALAVYQEAVAALGTVDMWERYVAFLLEGEGTEEALTQAVTDIWQEAESAGAAGGKAKAERLYHLHVQLLERLGREDESTEALRRSVKSLPDCGPLAITLASALTEEGEHSEAMQVLKDSLKSVPPSSNHYPELWQALVELAHSSSLPRDDVATLYRDGIVACSPPSLGHKEAATDLAVSYVEWVDAGEGAAATAEAFETVQPCLACGGVHQGLAKVWQAVIASQLAAGGSSPGAVRGMFERALLALGDSSPQVGCCSVQWQETACLTDVVRGREEAGVRLRLPLLFFPVCHRSCGSSMSSLRSSRGSSRG
ncbi:unnamed protein product, partial [Chrysoparadoxa australica]